MQILDSMWDPKYVVYWQNPWCRGISRKVVWLKFSMVGKVFRRKRWEGRKEEIHSQGKGAAACHVERDWNQSIISWKLVRININIALLRDSPDNFIGWNRQMIWFDICTALFPRVGYCSIEDASKVSSRGVTLKAGPYDRCCGAPRFSSCLLSSLPWSWRSILTFLYLLRIQIAKYAVLEDFET